VIVRAHRLEIPHCSFRCTGTLHLLVAPRSYCRFSISRVCVEIVCVPARRP